MPKTWIERDIQRLFQPVASPLQLFPVWLLLGPRQVGKSSLLHHVASPERQFIDLDDLAVRQRAQEDPVLFSRGLRLPLAIDEIQYAPALLSPIKQLADRGAPPGAIWLTGSQSFEIMAGVRETLAGRVAIMNLLGLSDHEKRQADNAFGDSPQAYFQSMFSSTFPRLHGIHDEPTRSLYLSSYVQTYLERDVRELMGIQKRREFEVFLKVCALRTGQIVNYDELARSTGVTAATTKEWLSLLENSFVVRLVQPYHANRNKRLIKSAKLYFLDTGLAAYLAGWRDGEMARLSPMGGALFETHVFGNIVRQLSNTLTDGSVHYWRTRDGVEIDFLVEARGSVLPIEVKMGRVSPGDLTPLTKIAEPHWQPGLVVSLASASYRDSIAQHAVAITSQWSAIHPSFLADRIGT